MVAKAKMHCPRCRRVVNQTSVDVKNKLGDTLEKWLYCDLDKLWFGISYQSYLKNYPRLGKPKVKVANTDPNLPLCPECKQKDCGCPLCHGKGACSCEVAK